ncbi:MAG TPA: histidinol-phosphate aminotransferase family protein [Thermoanaerobacterales bacterium]|jgi:histidinol-phosphate aminotransferase|nr:histidinol-phosphate aminotransferase family protein [Thermoanaerobacterales bacterium]
MLLSVLQHSRLNQKKVKIKGTISINKIIRKIRPVLHDFKPKSYTKDPWEKLIEYNIKKEDVIDCSLGVNPYGCSTLAEKATKNVDWNGMSKYPDTSYSSIKKAIVNFWSDTAELKEEEIFLGAGSVNVLVKLNRLFIQSGSKVLGYCPQFSEYENLVKIHGGVYDFISLREEENYKFPYKRFLNAIDESYNVIYIDNPNNPTGQVIDISIIDEIAKKAANYGIPVILDEAYGDYMNASNSAISICEKYDNLLIVRSFSKGLGLANIRLGYLIVKGCFKEYYNTVNIPPFAFPDIMSGIIIETLNDSEFILQCRKKIKKNKAELVSICKEKFTIAETGLEVPILTLGCKDKGNLYNYFLKNGIITAPGEEFTNLDENYVRLRIPSDIKDLLGRVEKMD